ncbi:MAG: TonB-dependent receptor [Bacteroidota bacterium]
MVAGFSCYAQTIELSGKVSDKFKNNLPNANIIAIPTENSKNLLFAITDDKGNYVLKLNSNESYEIKISYIGFKRQTFRISVSNENLKKDFELQENPERLDEIIINYKPAIITKKDTITYNTNSFVTGEERKLREVLKKLPGIEVDREGNVTAQGKKVTKVLVEDKIFFTGNSKLAVNNIPADAVDQVQVLDNYNEIGFLKGLRDSDDLALNIKLKGDKKKFAFGDIEAAGGVEDRYLLHPNLFYYSPKTNVNFIGDLNNLGIQSFTLNDYLEFNGGFGKLMTDMGSFFRLSNDDFSQFLSNTDFTANINRFGAFNLRQSLSTKTDINSFIIVNASDTETEVQTLNTYNSLGGAFDEDRNQRNTLDNSFVLGKLTLDYEPSINVDLSANTFVKVTQNDTQGRLLTQSLDQSTFFNTANSLDAIDLKQNLEYSKRFSRAQTLSFETTFAYVNSTPLNTWQTDEPFLEGLVPLQEDGLINVAQQKETTTTTFDAILKDYWVLNNYNHIYTTLGTNLTFENYQSQEEQLLSDGTLNDFSLNGFGNDIDYRFNDTFFGLEYKFLTGIFTVKSGVFYHMYFWENEQLGQTVSNSTQALLPEVKAEAEFNNSEKLLFRYRQRLQFPTVNRLAGNFVLNSFNSVLLGNPDLQNERIHNYSLNYYKFSLFRGLNVNTGINYSRKSQSVKNTTALDGIEQFATYTMFNEPENSVSANFNFSKRMNTVKLGLDSRTSYSEFFQLVNANVSKNFSRSLSLTGKMETLFENWPNLELGYTYEPSVFTTSVNRNQFTNTEFFAGLDYVFLKDFHLKADYRRTDYENQSQNLTNIFDLANASLYYQKDDSPWGFEVLATNLFDIRFRRSNSFSDFLISDQTTFIIPRIIMFKIAYKL